MSAEARWYAVQTYSGHENKVKKLMDFRIAEEAGDTPEEKEIREALVPTQEVTEIRNGKRVQVTKRLYPGYVLVNMKYNQRTMHVINNIQGVIKFVGGGGVEPQPLREDEMNKILGVVPEVAEEEAGEEIPFRPDQVVEVMEGPFKDFSGTVQAVDHDKGKVKVEVSLFGRATLVELDYTQLKGF
jgi:transcription termination/antitermination protein NusG